MDDVSNLLLYQTETTVSLGPLVKSLITSHLCMGDVKQACNVKTRTPWATLLVTLNTRLRNFQRFWEIGEIIDQIWKYWNRSLSWSIKAIMKNDILPIETANPNWLYWFYKTKFFHVPPLFGFDKIFDELKRTLTLREDLMIQWLMKWWNQKVQ